MGQYMIYVWLAVFAICLVVELVDAGTLISCWFSVGAIIPFFMGFYKTNNVGYIIAQVLIFGVVSALCLVFVRKFAIKLLHKHDDGPAGLDRYIGKELTISSINETDNLVYAKLNGVEYELLTEEKLAKGDKVKIVKFEGNKIVVKK